MSPSPTFASSASSSLCLAISTSHVRSRTRRRSRCADGARTSLRIPGGNGAGMTGRGEQPRGHARGPTGERSASKISGSRSESAETENPFMSSDVMRRAGPKTRRTSCPSVALSKERVASAISIGGIPPRSFTSRAIGDPSRAPSASSRRPIIVRASSRTGPSGAICAPGSPWIPRPSSTSPSAMRLSSGACPGMLHDESEAPMETTDFATRSAPLFTSPSERPARAR